MRHYPGLLCLVAIAAYARPIDIRPGEPAAIEADAGTIDFLLKAKTRTLSAEGLVAAPNPEGDQILIAPSPSVKPGTYKVTLSATSPDGEVRETPLEIVVKPLVTVPLNSKRAPVVLLNGWTLGYVGTCPVASSSSQVFGNLAQYLISDGVPVVYFFDNCAVGANQTVEVLAAGLSSLLNSIKYDDGSQVQQIDLVGFSLGGLIARAYLSGIQPSQVFLPPSPTLVHKLILIATPNGGSYVAGNFIGQVTAGSQFAELQPGSSLLWNLATWNQHGDDLLNTDAIAVVGNAGTYTSNATSGTAFPNAGDGLVTTTSASMAFVANPVESNNTRIVPYCHVDPSQFLNTSLGSYLCSAAGIANVTDTSHLTGQIVRSFLAGNTSWTSIGTAPSSDSYLAKNGGLEFTLLNSAGSYMTDLNSVSFGTLMLQNGSAIGNVFFADLISGTGTLTAVSQSLGSVNCGSFALPPGYISFARCKIATDVFSAGPLVGSTGRIIAPGSTIAIAGVGFGNTQCNGCAVQASISGSGSTQNLSVTSWKDTQISAKLPASLTGLVILTIKASGGADSIWIYVSTGPTLTVSPSSLTFTAAASQTLQINNAGGGTLTWTAAVSDPWLSMDATSGTAPSTPSVLVDPTGLTAGTYNGTVTITASGATGSPVTIKVTLTVSQAQSASFQYTIGGTVPAAQTISVSAPSATSWTASADSWWIALSPATGTTPGTLAIAPNPVNLAPGTYNGNVTLTGGVTPAAIPVTLVVQGTPATPAITGAPGVAPATWISIFGSNLSQTTYSWQSSDFVNGNLPTSLQGVSVTINGKPAYVGYISPAQINALAPDDSTTGPVQVVVTTAQQPSNAITVQAGKFSPTFLAAVHADYTPITASSPAKPGDTIVIYGTGFGPTTPPQPTGQLVTTPVPLANDVTLTMGGQPAALSYAGLVSAGIYQLNAIVPAVPNGDTAIQATIGGVTTQQTFTIPVSQ
jgi:uncharacterized protein (TIGR03437 family)